jgi:hypothetical protein
MFEDTTPYDILTEKWEPVLSHSALPAIEDSYKAKVTAVLLENQESAMRQQRLVEDNTLGGPISNVFGNASSTNIAGYDPILISLVRRAMPNLIAYDICGVQPMTAPTGLIFAMRPKYDPNGGPRKEAMYQEPFVPFGGSGGTGGFGGDGNSYTNYFGGSADYGLTLFGGSTGATRTSALYGNDFKGLLVSDAESLGNTKPFQEMAFTIDKVAVQAKTRALKADYTTELAQDLKAVHGLDAETELANILSTEILAEINREVVRGIYHVSKIGAQQGDLFAKSGSGSAAFGGVYDLLVDSDGRWSAERFRGLMFQIEREANAIAKETRRGKGNFIICSSDVASALAMGGFLNISPALNQQLEVDDTGNTFAGVLNGKMRVYIDPYVQSGVDFVCVGYRGSSPYDAGLFYCPYVPLQMVRAVDPDTFQPKIGFKTRYGMVANPFVLNAGGTPDGETLTANLNQYYRIFRVLNLHGNSA